MLIASDETILQKVRERAYAIWEREGRPDGRDREHWTMAEKEVTPMSLSAKPVKKAANGAAKAAPKTRAASAAAKVTPKTTRRKASPAKSK